LDYIPSGMMWEIKKEKRQAGIKKTPRFRLEKCSKNFLKK
jgi:hypothetical protein